MKITGKSVVVTGGSFLRKATDYDGWLSRTRGRLRAMG
jgi:hypothetical protein